MRIDTCLCRRRPRASWLATAVLVRRLSTAILGRRFCSAAIPSRRFTGTITRASRALGRALSITILARALGAKSLVRTRRGVVVRVTWLLRTRYVTVLTRSLVIGIRGVCASGLGRCLGRVLSVAVLACCLGDSALNGDCGTKQHDQSQGKLKTADRSPTRL